MKLFNTLCLFSVIVVGSAMPQQNGILDMDNPFSRPDPPQPDDPNHDPMAYPDIENVFLDLMIDIQDFVDILPLRQIQKLMMMYSKDPKFQETMNFLQSEEFQEIMVVISNTREFTLIAQYFDNANWPWIQRTIEEELFGFELQDETHLSRRRNEGLSGLLNDIAAILPWDQMAQLYWVKMETSAVFRSVMEIVTSDEVKDLIKSAMSSNVVKRQFEILLAHDIDVVKVLDVLGF